MKDQGIFYGIGVGTGDPEYLTLKAVRLIQQADVIAYLKSTTGTTIALDIAAQWIDQQAHLSITMPYKTDRSKANQAYDHAAERIADVLQKGLTVAFLCEGDPLFFGSFIYLHQRLSTHYPCQVVAGVSSINAAAARAQIPLTQQNDRLAIVSARNTDQEILHALTDYSSVVIMKAGQARERLLKLIQQSQRLNKACYIEKVGQTGETVRHDVASLKGKGNYFSLFIVY